MSAASRNITASSASTSRKPAATVNGSRSAAISGGRMAFSTATIAATSTAPQKPLTLAPGTIPAATSRASADDSHANASRSGRNRGLTGLHASACACGGVMSRRRGLGDPGAEELERPARLRRLLEDPRVVRIQPELRDQLAVEALRRELQLEHEHGTEHG